MIGIIISIEVVIRNVSSFITGRNLRGDSRRAEIEESRGNSTDIVLNALHN